MQECDKIKRHVSSLTSILKCSLTGWANEDNRSAPVDASILSNLRIALGPGEIWAVHDAAADSRAHTQICRRWFWPRDPSVMNELSPWKRISICLHVTGCFLDDSVAFALGLMS